MFWNILLGIASYALQLILAPKPQSAKPASLEDFDAPIAEEGVEIPDLFGTDQLRVPNVVWYGDYAAVGIKGPRRYGFFGPRSTVGYRYKLGMHMVWCSGPVDNVSEIRIGDKIAWSTGIESNGIISISQPDLFGGDEGEGGVSGSVSALFGGPGQTQDIYLLAILGSLLPAFRGVLSFVLQQFYVGNSPYIKPWEITTQRIYLRPGGSDQWYSEKAGIPRVRTASNARPHRTVSNTTVASGRSFDLSGDIIAHLNSTLDHLIIEDLRTGTVNADITLTYTALWVYVRDSTDQVLVLEADGNIRVYDSATGALLQTVTGFGDPTPTGDSHGTLTNTPNEITDGGTTYLFFGMTFNIVCLADDGSGWDFLWNDPQGSVFVAISSISVGPDYLYARVTNNSIWRFDWSAAGLGTRYIPNVSAMGATGAINMLSYSPTNDRVVVIDNAGHFLVTSADMTISLAFSSGGGWLGSGFADWINSRNLMDGTTAAFYQDGKVYLYDTTTAAKTHEYSMSEWGLTPFGASGAFGGFSAAEQAWVVLDNSFNAVVLFLGQVLDMNPAHIIRECITHRMGYADADINDDDVAPGFTYAADTLFDEGFGLTFKWSREEEVGEFVNMNLSHIDAYAYTSRTTGKFNLKLVRNDYDIDTIPVITEDDVVEWSEVSRRGLADAINSVTVKYTDRLNRGRDASHQVDNIAQMQQMDGQRVAITRNYPGISTGNLAVRVARRDVKSLGIGMISGRIVCKRTIESWVNPGEPFRLVSSRHNLEGEVMRVADIEFGDGRDNRITIKFVQDVFHLGAEELVDTAASDWENPANPPQAVSPRLVWEMPYLQLRRYAGAASANEALAGDADFGAVEAAGAKPSSDTTSAIISVAKNAGSYVDRDVMTFAPAGIVDGAIDEQATTLTLTDESDLTLIEDGTLALIDGNDPDLMEVVRVDGVSGLDLTISRGFLDTVPRAHADGAELIVFDDFTQGDGEPYTSTDTVAVKLRPTTPLGTLALASAPADTIDLDSRAVRPLRPADCQVDGAGYGPVDVSGLSPIPAIWARRNRLTETTPLAWDDADVSPEASQTTTIRLLDPGGIVIDDTTYTAIAGTTQDIDPADFAGATSALVEFLSVRGSYDSWQSYRIAVFFDDELLLEGDEQAGTDVLALEGDESGSLRLEGST